jgi:hypothetical protein
VAPPAHPRSLFKPIVFLNVQVFIPEAEFNKRATSPIGKLCITSLAPSVGMIFQLILIHSKSEMVNTRSSQLLRPTPNAPGASNDPELADFLKSMAKSMEVLRKQNEELNARLMTVET